MTRPPYASSGSLPLSFGGEQFSGLVAGGLLGMLPTTTWFALLTTVFDRPGLVIGPVVGFVGVGLALFTLLVAPWLVPCLVLRARQPRGARIEWTDLGVTEFDGDWRRAFVPWDRARATQHTWEVQTRLGSRTYEALQLAAEGTGDVITAWPSQPPGSPVIRRRLCSDRTPELRAAIDAHRIPVTDGLDAALAKEEGRSRPGWALWLGRPGYVLGVVAPLVAGPAPEVGMGLAAIGAAMLACRALPVLAEVRALLGRGTLGRGTLGEQRTAERLRLRAAVVEAAVRLACPALLLAAGMVSAVMLAF